MKEYLTISNFLSDNEKETLVNIAATSIMTPFSPQFENGRQGTGYKKLNIKLNVKAFDFGNSLLEELIQRSLKVIDTSVNSKYWDAYILWYPKGSFISKHTDEAEMFGLKHYRLNAMIRGANTGGELIFNDHLVTFVENVAIIFNPDEIEHQVNTVLSGERFIWSVGAWR